MKKIQLFLILCCSFFGSVQAQNYLDLVNVFYTNTPLNQFDSSLSKTRVQDLSFSSTLPIKINDKTNFITGLDVEWMYANLTPTGQSGSVTGIIFKAGLNRQISERWSGTAVVIPRLASDLVKTDIINKIVKEDFQLGGLLLFKYAKSPQLKYKMALYYNGELFGPFISPLLGLYYKSLNQKFEADLTLPFMADINYHFDPKVYAGVRFNAFVRTYNLHQTYYQDKGEYLAKTSNELYTYLGFEPKKGIILKANLGYSVGRNYRLYDIQDKVAFGLSAFRFGDKRKQLNSDFADGLLFRIDLIYRFYLVK
ncbi:MAG: DUF6268 family outer membrane beta-barrel protein [Bacteroidia bacterium]|nr:DUF6268 family outer membrane beta-barrel protein [Bacteroidia bacterium]MCF8427611.1 DUF6268 family outer membrane beta-barrel protein [Bacteroidia bacterium]MCF8447637.1 DUF6268 family outer membrane beta-barrel protein [Bacteroidia bacterium]